MQYFLCIISFVGMVIFTQPVFAQGAIQSRFKNNSKLEYQVYFNGGRSGIVQWEYMGQERIGEQDVDV